MTIRSAAASPGEGAEAAGINVCFGHDDVFDPWYPLGTGNMLQVLHMGLHVCQMMGYPQIDSGLNLITHNSARTFGLSDYGIETGNPANLIILPAESGFEAVRCQVPVRWSIRQGRIIATTQLAQTWIQMDTGEKRSVCQKQPLCVTQRGAGLSEMPLPRCAGGGGSRSPG
jgi:cytosine deaminase